MNDFIWWRDGVIYQIYPRSFMDKNDDGLGDLPGITSKMDYLADLGVDALWLSPIYPSPDKDFGYDVEDYMDIDPRFGSLEDFNLLLSEAHKRNIHIILDLVLNHTSDHHAWFQESRSSHNNSKADWYIWQDNIPNNWQSIFGGSAWNYVPEREQFYYHMFLPEQPDVNWRNPKLRSAMMEVVRYWLDRGVDGFRLDVFNMYFKDEQLRENPYKFGVRAFDRQHHIFDCDQPEMLPLLQELRSILDSYPNRYAVGETIFPTPEKIVQYSGPDKLHAAFIFDFTKSPFDPAKLLKPVLEWEKLSAEHNLWPNYVFGNHDLPRMATRYTNNEDDTHNKVLMALLLTLRGTPFLYYGEEIGMRDISLKRGEILDPPGKKYWPLYKGRDGCRSPMQWNSTINAGFSKNKPWLPVHPNYLKRNVKTQQSQPDSMLNFTRRLIHLRREKPALQRGKFILITKRPGQALIYLRQTPEQTILVALNFKRQSTIQEIPGRKWNLLFSTNSDSISEGTQRIQLAGHEVLILEVV